MGVSGLTAIWPGYNDITIPGRLGYEIRIANIADFKHILLPLFVNSSYRATQMMSCITQANERATYGDTEAETVPNPMCQRVKQFNNRTQKGQALALDLANPFPLIYKLSHPTKTLQVHFKEAMELAGVVTTLELIVAALTHPHHVVLAL